MCHKPCARRPSLGQDDGKLIATVSRGRVDSSTKNAEYGGPGAFDLCVERFNEPTVVT